MKAIFIVFASFKLALFCVALQCSVLLGTALGQNASVVGSNLMLVGDSFTNGSTEWARRVDLSPEFSLDFFSEPGRTINTMALLFGGQYQANTYDTVVIAGGVNDVVGNRNAVQIQASIETIIDETNGEHIILTTIAPFRGRLDSWTQARQDVADQVDTWILATAAESDQISVFDIRSILDADNNQVIDSAMDIGDGLHPGICPLSSECGSSVIADAFINQFYVVLGDVSRDGQVNFLDITPFISVLLVGGFLDEADIDRNEVVNFLDIQPFISILSGQ